MHFGFGFIVENFHFFLLHIFHINQIQILTYLSSDVSLPFTSDFPCLFLFFSCSFYYSWNWTLNERRTKAFQHRCSTRSIDFPGIRETAFTNISILLCAHRSNRENEKRWEKKNTRANPFKFKAKTFIYNRTKLKIKSIKYWTHTHSETRWYASHTILNVERHEN